MAVQPHKKVGAKILRTPAPDEVTEIRNPKGGSGYGQNSSANNPSSIAPGKAAESALASNLRQSQSADAEDDVLSQVIAQGIAGRDDQIPADGDYNDAGGQLRRVSDVSYPPTHGAVRQQDPNFWAKPKSAALPEKQIDNETQPARKPV